MRRVVVVLVVLLLLAGGAWFVTDRGHGGPDPAGPTVVDGNHARAGEDAPGRRHVSVEPDAAASPDASPDDPPDDPPGDAADADERPLIEVVDAAGEPLAGVTALFHFSTRLRTGADGRVRSLVPAGEWIRLPSFDLDVEVEAPLTRVQIDGARPIELRFVDQETRRPLAVAWGVEREPRESRAATWGRVGGNLYMDLGIDAPQGWVSPLPDDDLHDLDSVSPRAQQVLAVIAVPRELRVTVTVLHADGSAAEGAGVSVRISAERYAQARDTGVTGADGRAELRGVPFMRGERVIVDAGLRVPDPELLEFVEASVRSEPMTELRERIELTVRLPEEPSDAAFQGPGWSGTIGIGGSLGGDDDEESAPRGTVRVRARLRDGRPAADSVVSLQGPSNKMQTTDADGIIVFDGMPAGEYDAWLLEAGIVPTRVHFELAVGGEATVEIVEAAGRSLDVEVVDARGTPLPGARVHVRTPGWLPHWPYQHVEGGVQHMPAATDARGRIRMSGLADDVGQIAAAHGSRQASVDVGTSTDPVRIVIPDAE